MAKAQSMLLLAGLLSAAVSQASPSISPFKEEVRAGLEEIFVFRTTRTRHTAGSTPVCASAPFQSVNEDYYALWAIRLRDSDSRVVDTHRREVGGFTACFSQLVVGQPVQMYATGTVAHIPWTGMGDCTVQKAQPPVRTVIAFSCVLSLTGVPEGYSGGSLTSSTLAPFLGKGQDPTAHVPGYLSTSVVTLRLWKKPVGAR